MNEILFPIFLSLLGVFFGFVTLFLTGQRAKKIATGITGALLLALGTFWLGYAVGTSERLPVPPGPAIESVTPASMPASNTITSESLNPQATSTENLAPLATATVTAVTVQIMPSQVFLQDMPIESGDTPGKGLAIISGQSFPNSLRYEIPCCVGTFKTDYNLGGRFTHFRSSIGLEDKTDQTAEYEVYLDDVRLFVKNVDSTTPFAVDLDITNGDRLTLVVRLSCLGICDSRGAANWGDAIVTNP